jgi:hypothetical protein
LQKEGKIEEILSIERQKNEKLIGQIKDLQNKTLKSKIISTVAKHAKDAFDINDILVQKDFIENLDIDSENLEVNEETVISGISQLREKKKYLFDLGKIPKMVSGRPSKFSEDKKTMSEMTQQERDLRLKESLSKILT